MIFTEEINNEISNDIANNDAEDRHIGEEDILENSIEESAKVENDSEISKLEIVENKDFKWYVMRAATGYENKVVDFLTERIKQQNMQEFFGPAIVPTEEIVEIKSGVKRKSRRKFFPGYVLVQMNMTDESWLLIRNIPKALGFIGGTKNKPVPISEKEAAKILNRINETEKSEPVHKVLYEVGEVIRVMEGPFADFNGVVEEINYEKNRLVVAVLIFGRSTPVELEFSQVEKSS